MKIFVLKKNSFPRKMLLRSAQFTSVKVASLFYLISKTNRPEHRSFFPLQSRFLMFWQKVLFCASMNLILTFIRNWFSFWLNCSMIRNPTRKMPSLFLQPMKQQSLLRIYFDVIRCGSVTKTESRLQSYIRFLIFVQRKAKRILNLDIFQVVMAHCLLYVLSVRYSNGQ